MQNAFNPQEMALLIHVVDQACADLGGCDEATKAMMAARVLACASQGERDFNVLLSVATRRVAKEAAHAA